MGIIEKGHSRATCYCCKCVYKFDEYDIKREYRTELGFFGSYEKTD